MIYYPSEHPPLSIYKLLIGAVVPRPIAFVSTVDAAGVRNLAPFSFFTAVSSDPAVLCFSAGLRAGAKKDTLVNVEETGEFVVNVVTEALAEAMNLTAAEYPPEVDEFAVAGLTAVPATVVKAPRVAESPVSFECKLRQVIPVGNARLVLGDVVCVHADDSLVSDFKIDAEKLQAVGRMGGNSYTRTRERFDMMRPK